MIFLRYTMKQSAIKCLEKYESEKTLRIAEEKCSKGPTNQPRGQKRDDDMIMSKRKSGKSFHSQINIARFYY